MRQSVHPGAGPPRLPAELVSDLWLRLSEHEPFAIAENEVHYLSAVALGLDDDIASLLLLKKLKLARKLAPEAVPDDLVVMNSFVEFRFGGGNRRFCQVLHPSVCRGSFAVSIASRLGAGLIGLHAGQTVLWPDDSGELEPLHVLAVKPSLGRHSRTRKPALNKRG